LNSSPDTTTAKPSRLSVAVLSACVVAAAVLRFSGIGWGLRQLPQQFERVFVQSVWDMVAAGDLDQRCYLYPGLIFYLLAIPVWFVQRLLHLGIRDAYLASRCFVACFGVANVWLAYRVGREIADERVGIAGALLLALSPLEVENAHAVRPDVILETALLLAIPVFRRAGPRLSDDIRAALALGASGAIKVTGVLLAPVYVGYRLLGPAPRLQRILLVAFLSVLVFFAFTPYGVLAPERFCGGFHEQLAYHYQERPGALSHAHLLLFYLGAVSALLGPVGVLLLIPGLAACRRQWRSWGPILCLPAGALLLFSTAKVGAARFLLPSGGVLALVAAEGFWEVTRRWPRLAAVVAATAVAFPLNQSLSYVRNVRKPTPADLALDWIGLNEPDGARIVTTEKHLGLTRPRFDVYWPVTNFWEGQSPVETDRIVALYSDLVVASPTDATIRGFRELVRFDPAPGFDQAGPSLGLYKPPERRRLTPDEVGLRASENSGLLSGLQGGERSTGWHTDHNQGPDDWLQIDLKEPRTLGALRLTFRNHLGSPLRVVVAAGDGSWQEVVSVERKHAESVPPWEELLLGPLRVRSLRIVPTKPSSTRWFLVGLEVNEVLGAD
jgi:hypothetical protein